MSLYRVPIQSFESEERALQALELYADKFYFRGQSRRVSRLWPPTTTARYSAGFIKTESIVPGAYREMEDGLRAGKAGDPSFRYRFGPEVDSARAAAAYIALGEAPNTGGNVDAWLADLAGPHVSPDQMMHRLVSLAQHCGIPTLYVDLTVVPDRAMWFATRTWEGEVLKTGCGVVYRFDRSRLHEALSKNVASGPHKYSAVVDVSDTPPEITPRPSLQRGLTAFGLERGEVMIHLLQHQGVEAFVFKRDGLLALPSKDEIRPPGDPMEEAIKRLVGGQSVQEWQVLTNQFLQRIDPAVQPPDLSDQGLRGQILQGFPSSAATSSWDGCGELP
jgi:hypothetical protein